MAKLRRDESVKRYQAGKKAQPVRNSPRDEDSDDLACVEVLDKSPIKWDPLYYYGCKTHRSWRQRVKVLAEELKRERARSSSCLPRPS